MSTNPFVIIFAAIFVAVSLGLILFYSKSKREREKETTLDIFLRVALPSCLITLIIIGGVFHKAFTSFQISNPFRMNSAKEFVYINEPFDT